MNKMSEEIWRDIPNFEGKYQASNFGRIYSIVRNQIKSQREDKDGYYRVTLIDKEGKSQTLRVNRLIAITFLDQPEGKNIVNHIDSNRQNNRVENLEWTDASGNMKHGYLYGDVKRSTEKALEASKLVNTKTYQIWKDDKLIGEFYGLKETAKAIDVDEKTVRNCLKENRKTRYGYSFIRLGGD